MRTDRTINTSSISAAIFILVICLGLSPAFAGPPQFGSTPPSEGFSKKWRIAYYEGGDYVNYQDSLQAIVKGMMTLGWIEESVPPPDMATEELWQWLAKNVRSQYLEFIADAYYSADWQQDKRATQRQAFIDRLNRHKDIDLVLGMGTWAGQDLANNNHRTPTFLVSITDPVGSGIIKSAHDSGYDHVFARVSPQRYERQLRLFHEAIGFKRLGIAYENSAAGRTYTALDTIKRIAAERQFEVVHCHTLSDIPEIEEAVSSVLACIDKLAPEVDALYITEQGGVTKESIPKIVSIANKYGIPTLSQRGSEQVKYGILIGMSRPDTRPLGLFLASNLGQVINGAKPRDLTQLFEEEPNISINLKTAEIIGLYLRAEWLAAADDIYREIETPE